MNWILTPKEVGMVYSKFLNYESTVYHLTSDELLACCGPEEDDDYIRLKQMLIEANDRKQYNLDFKDYLK